MNKAIICFTGLLISVNVFGQKALRNLSKMKIIHAKSKMVSIREENELQQNSWTIVPSAKPDVYETSSKKVTFITDVDSITFKTELNGVYNFLILLDNDSAWTQIKCVPSKLEILKQVGGYKI